MTINIAKVKATATPRSIFWESPDWVSVISTRSLQFDPTDAQRREYGMEATKEQIR